MKKLLVALVMGLAMLVNAAPAVDAAPVQLCTTSKGWCVYVEDTQVGIQAGKAWGNVIVVLPDGGERYWTTRIWHTARGPVWSIDGMNGSSFVKQGTWQGDLFNYFIQIGLMEP